MFWNSGVKWTLAVSREKHDEELVNVSKFQCISAFQWGIGCHLLSLIFVAGSHAGSRPHSWLQLAGARVGNKHSVFCNSRLRVLSVDTEHWGASTKSGSHCFNLHRLKQLLWDLKRQYIYLFLFVLLCFPLGSQKFNKIFAGLQADCRDNTIETLITDYTQEIPTLFY